MDIMQKCIESIQLELGKLRKEVDEIKTNHLVHVAQSISGLETKLNFGLVFMGLVLALNGLTLALVAIKLVD